jgi:hypothetical protein
MIVNIDSKWAPLLSNNRQRSGHFSWYRLSKKASLINVPVAFHQSRFVSLCKHIIISIPKKLTDFSMALVEAAMDTTK